MEKTREEASAWISRAVAALAILVAVGVVAYMYTQGELEHLRLENLRTRRMQPIPATASLSELWFAPNGTILTTFENESKRSLLIGSWSPEGTPLSLKTFSFIDNVTVNIELLNSFHGSTANDTTTGLTNPKQDLAYAVSDDASTIVWIWQGKLYSQPLDKSDKPVSATPTPPAETSTVILTKQYLVSFFNTRKELWTWNIRSGRIGRTSFTSKGADLFWGRQSFRVAPGANLLIDTKNLPRIQSDNLPSVVRGTTCFAISPGGKVLAGTESGLIFAPEVDSMGRLSGMNRFIFLEGMGRVRSISFFDETWAIAGGDSSKVFLIKDGTLGKVLAPAHPDLQFLAVQGNHIAYATSDWLLAVGNLNWTFELSDRAKWWLALMFSFVGLLGFIRVIAIDTITLRYYRNNQKTNKAKEPERPALGKGATSAGKAPTPPVSPTETVSTIQDSKE